MLKIDIMDLLGENNVRLLSRVSFIGAQQVLDGAASYDALFGAQVFGD